MKRKALFVAALVGLGSFANAQTTQVTNEAGYVVTPEAGDWAIGFNASPLFNYVGNAFNGSTGNTMSTAFANGNVQGLEFGQLPSARSLGFNVSVKF